MSGPRPLPSLQLPVAFVRFWPSAADLAETVEELPPIAGVERVSPRLLAVRPVEGRGDVFDVAARLAGALLVRRARTSGGAKLPGILIFPGRLDFGTQVCEPVSDSLFEDLESKAPHLPPGKIILTGYVASWLAGRYDIEDVGVYEAPSGHRVPLVGLGAERAAPKPWHNPEILGRHLYVARERLEGRLAGALANSPCLISGPLGVGKTRSLSAALDDLSGPKIWVGLGRALPSLPLLARSLARDLRQRVPGAGISPERLAGLDSAASAELLVGWLAEAENRLGDAPWLICDVAEAATEGDRDLLRRMLADTRFRDVCRLVLVERSGMAGQWTDDAFSTMTEIRLDPFDEEEMPGVCEKLFHGLELEPAVQERFVTAAAGHPFALEEGLLRLVHRGLVRQVYGSFFYAGGEEVEYQPSERLIRHVEAEVDRLGAPLPLRILAVADEPITPVHLRSACLEFGFELDEDWHRPYVDSGWLERVADPGGNLRFACPAHGMALRATVVEDGIRTLRHALGGVLADVGHGANWTAYRLMAGSPEALPSLLDFTRESNEEASREEVFNALWDEYREHRARWGDEATELEILWVLLPLARRLGCLGQLRRELDRGVELARGQEQRYVALVALSAELAQEQGDFRAAEKGLREALRTSEGFDEKRRATLFIRLGALLHREERWTEAREVFENLLSVVDQSGPTPVGATCRFYLGNIALQQRKLDEAEALHCEATELRRGKGSKRQLGTSLSALGAVSIARGDYPTALARFREALEALEGSEPSERSFAQLGLGRALGHLGDLAGAAKVLREGLEARQGRDDRQGEAIARLELAENALAFDQLGNALDETRRAHFHLSLIPEVALLGDAERMLGRVLLRQGELEEAQRHLEEALRIHVKHGDTHGQLEDHSWIIETHLRSGDWEPLHQHALALEQLLERVPNPTGGEALGFRLYRAFKWLGEHGFESGDPVIYLRRSYKELMRKTNFLEPDQRHNFLYQIREHQDILDAAATAQISLPVFTITPSG